MTSTLLAVNWTNALIITFLGFTLVVVLLICLIFVMKGFSWLFTNTRLGGTNKGQGQAPSQAAPAPVASAPGAQALSDLLTDEELAAVAIALDKTFYSIHDTEDLKLTFSHSEHETDWSSKYSTLNQ